MQARMNGMSLSMAALSADKSNLEERLAREEVHRKKTQMHTFWLLYKHLESLDAIEAPCYRADKGSDWFFSEHIAGQ